LYRYSVSQSGEFSAITICVASQRCLLLLFISLWLSPETFGFTLICRSLSVAKVFLIYLTFGSWLFRLWFAVLVLYIYLSSRLISTGELESEKHNCTNEYIGCHDIIIRKIDRGKDWNRHAGRYGNRVGAGIAQSV
jgi:hypothetical protein